MEISAATLRDLTTGFRTEFNVGLGLAPSQWRSVAMPAPSTAITEKYPWLKDMPGLREWVGDRVVHQLAVSVYEITNKEYEGTFEVPLRMIETDQYGTFGPLARVYGESYGSHPDQTVFAALAAGFTTLCHDGQYFFDTDHPLLNKDGVTVDTYSNAGGGSGAAWYLLCTNRALKPLIFQERKAEPFEKLTPMEAIADTRKVKWGCYRDCAVGYSFPQFAYASQQTLNATNYAAARAAVASFKGDHGRPLGLVPNLLVFPPALEGAARSIIINEFDAAGASNPWKGTAELLMVPWLA